MIRATLFAAVVLIVAWAVALVSWQSLVSSQSHASDTNPSAGSPIRAPIPAHEEGSSVPGRSPLPRRGSGELTGRVVESGTKRALSDVDVETTLDVEQIPFTCRTRSVGDGGFVLEAAHWQDPCSLRFARDGYRTLTIHYSGDGNVGEVSLTPSPSLQVMVLHAQDATPVPDVPVDIGPSTPNRLTWTSTQITNDDGVAVFSRPPDGGSRVRVRANAGACTVTLPSALPDRQVIVHLPSPRNVEVSIVDVQTRSPVQHAVLRRPSLPDLTSDDAGRCLVPVLAAEPTVVTLAAPGYFAARTLLDGGAGAIVIEARPTCTVRGRVDASEAVTLERTVAVGRSIATQLPALHIPPNASFEWSDIPAHGHLAVRCLIGDAVVATASTQTPEPGGIVDLAPIRPEAVARVRVRIVGSTPGPVGLSLSVRDARQAQLASLSVTMSPLREQTLTIPSGQLRLTAMNSAGGFARIETQLAPRAEIALSLHLAPSPDVPGRLRLLDADAPPLCEISCLPLEDGLPTRYAWPDAAGRFVLHGVPAGYYRVAVRPTHLSPSGYAYDSASRELQPGDTVLELTVARLGAQIRGRITGVPPDSSPPALVRAVDRDGRVYGGGIEPDHRFSILVPKHGPFRIEALTLHVPGSRGRHWIATREDVEPGATIELTARPR